MATRGSIPHDDGGGRHRHAAARGRDRRPCGASSSRAARPGEIVVAGTLGIMGAEYDPTGGLDVEKSTAIDVPDAAP